MTLKKTLHIPNSELEFVFSRSSGPGGQNVNKVETKVTVLFNYLSSRSLSWEEKGRLGANKQVQSRLDADGAIAISSQEHRTQTLNREEALRKLHDLLREALRRPRKRVPTKKTKGSERRRLQTKRIRGLTKSGRGRVTDE